MIPALEKIKEIIEKKGSIKGSEIEEILDDKSLSKEEILTIQNFLVESDIEIESDYDDLQVFIKNKLNKCILSSSYDLDDLLNVKGINNLLLK